MSKQAIQLAELFRQLPLVEKLQLMELMFREIKEQVLKKEKAAAHARKAGFSKAKFEMSPDFNEPLEDFKEYMQ
jgi:hypothetical protein